MSPPTALLPAMLVCLCKLYRQSPERREGYGEGLRRKQARQPGAAPFSRCHLQSILCMSSYSWAL